MDNVDRIALLRAHFPALVFREVRVVEDGWDSLVLDLDGRWIVRFPRRPEVAQRLEREIALLPELAMRLPVEVPRFDLIARNGVVGVAYRTIAGSPARDDIDEVTGKDLGRFLLSLRHFSVDRARELGIPFFDQAAWRCRYRNLCAEFRCRVGPLLAVWEREQAETIFSCVDELEFTPALLHADLGPEHVLCDDRRSVAGVIDWSDARVGDAALDLAWCLNGTPPEVAKAVARTYGVNADLYKRSLFYHQLGPWYEVIYGLETTQKRFVSSGIKGVRSRLPTQ